MVENQNDEWVTEDQKIHYRYGDYEEILNTLTWWSICKAYPRKTLFSINFSLVEIPEGFTASKLKRRWVRELQSHGVL